MRTTKQRIYSHISNYFIKLILPRIGFSPIQTGTMANLISLTAIPLTGATNWTSPCEAFEQQVDNIQTVKAYTGTQYGIQAVLNVKYVIANHFETQTIYVKETKAAVKAAANAALA